MNAGEARAEMLAYVAALREQLTVTPDPEARTALAIEARRQVERVRKRFKRRIDEQASLRFKFSVHAREGIERKLAEVTAEAMAAVQMAAASRYEPPAAANSGRL